MSDPHVLGADLAPTPFSAEQIRLGCPDGHWLLVRADEDGEVAHRRHRFEQGDLTGCTLTSVATDASGRPTGDPVRERVTWLDLQSHAAFPVELTTVATERIRLDFGERDCLRYDVASPGGASTSWFALAHPGMPVRRETGTAVVEVIAIG